VRCHVCRELRRWSIAAVPSPEDLSSRRFPIGASPGTLPRAGLFSGGPLSPLGDLVRVDWLVLGFPIYPVVGSRTLPFQFGFLPRVPGPCVLAFFPHPNKPPALSASPLQPPLRASALIMFLTMVLMPLSVRATYIPVVHLFFCSSASPQTPPCHSYPSPP